jgi:hypothetical protein
MMRPSAHMGPGPHGASEAVGQFAIARSISRSGARQRSSSMNDLPSVSFAFELHLAEMRRSSISTVVVAHFSSCPAAARAQTVSGTDASKAIVPDSLIRSMPTRPGRKVAKMTRALTAGGMAAWRSVLARQGLFVGGGIDGTSDQRPSPGSMTEPSQLSGFWRPTVERFSRRNQGIRSDPRFELASEPPQVRRIEHKADIWYKYRP